MNAKTNAQGKDRKNLVKAIAGITEQAAKYNGAPAFTYTVGNFTVERDGSITTEDEAGRSRGRDDHKQLDPDDAAGRLHGKPDREPRKNHRQQSEPDQEGAGLRRPHGGPYRRPGGIPLVQTAPRKRGKHGGHALHHSDLPDGQERKTDYRKREGSTE